MHIYMCVHTHMHLYVSVCVCACSVFATPWTIDLYASLFMGFSRQEYWSGLPFPTPDLHMDYRQMDYIHTFMCMYVHIIFECSFLCSAFSKRNVPFLIQSLERKFIKFFQVPHLQLREKLPRGIDALKSTQFLK